MKKWGLSLMLFAILAAPALACGFPLPAGTSMMAVSKAVCAVGEAADSCQVRQDAYQMMGKITSVTVSDMQADLLVDDGTSATEMHITGSFDYQATTSETGLGANVHAVVTDGTITSEGSEQSLSGTEFVVLENTAYTTTDSGANWVYEELDENAMLGLSFLLGLSGTMGTGLDLFSQPSGFTVTAGSDTEIDGQTMHVQTLTLNLEALLADPDAITSMLEESGEAMGEIGVDPSTLGDPAQLAMFAAILLPAFEGSEFFTTLYIGADDGYIHRIEENYVFMMDSSKIAFGTEEGEAPTVITMTYQLSGTLGQFNDSALVIAAPKNAVEGEGLLSEESGLFGGSGLGGSLFGQ
jgi:hypothetical protein